MYRIGILGAENSHALGFTQVFNGLRPEFGDEFKDIQVVAVGGHYPEANRALCEKAGLELMTDKPEDMLGKVDAVLVTARDGQFHAGFARPFIEAGLPVFVDKPFTRSVKEAVELARLAKVKGVPVVGGSSLKMCPDTLKMAEQFQSLGSAFRSGDVTAPISMVNDYGNFWFYAAHLAEITLAIFGWNPEWVWANATDKGVTAVIHYPGFDVTNHFIEEAYHYSCTLCSTEGIVYQPINIDDFIVLECRSVANMLRKGEMDFSYEQLVQPVALLEALEQSFLTGQKVPVPAFEI